MANGLILSFLPESLLIRMEQGKEVIGGWLYDLTEGKCEFIGQDEEKRIEVYVSFEVFEKIKTSRLFISKAGRSLRRIRTTPRNVLGLLLYSQYADFDNDLDV